MGARGMLVSCLTIESAASLNGVWPVSQVVRATQGHVFDGQGSKLTVTADPIGGVGDFESMSRITARTSLVFASAADVIMLRGATVGLIEATCARILALGNASATTVAFCEAQTRGASCTSIS